MSLPDEGVRVYRNVDSPDGDFGVKRQEGDETFVAFTWRRAVHLRATERRLAALTADRDALAALLKEARFFVPSHDDVAIRIDAALARIDAAGGGK